MSIIAKAWNALTTTIPGPVKAYDSQTRGMFWAVANFLAMGMIIGGAIYCHSYRNAEAEADKDPGNSSDAADYTNYTVSEAVTISGSIGFFLACIKLCMLAARRHALLENAKNTGRHDDSLHDENDPSGYSIDQLDQMRTAWARGHGSLLSASDSCEP